MTPVNVGRRSIDRSHVAPCDETTSMDPDLVNNKQVSQGHHMYHHRVRCVWLQVWCEDVHHQTILLSNHLVTLPVYLVKHIKLKNV